MRCAFTCILDSVPAVTAQSTRCRTILEQVSGKTCESKPPHTDAERSSHGKHTWKGLSVVTVLILRCKPASAGERRGSWDGEPNCSSKNCSRAPAANKRAWQWSRMESRKARERDVLAKTVVSGSRNVINRRLIYIPLDWEVWQCYLVLGSRAQEECIVKDVATHPVDQAEFLLEVSCMTFMPAEVVVCCQCSCCQLSRRHATRSFCGAQAGQT